MKQKPNLVIFRVPDVPDSGEHTPMRLVELNYLGDKLSDIGQLFMPHPESSYNELDFDRVVLARKTAEGSLELARYQVTSKDDKRVLVFDLAFDAIKSVVTNLLQAYNSTDASEHHS